jgi:hypothetical protein
MEVEDSNDLMQYSVNFKMDNTVALAPKGNMPHKPVHTDETFGVFQIRFKSQNNTPKIKSSATFYLNDLGICEVKKADLFEDLAGYTLDQFVFSKLVYSCENIGKNELIISLKDNLESWSGKVVLDILDSIPPILETKYPSLITFPLPNVFSLESVIANEGVTTKSAIALSNLKANTSANTVSPSDAGLFLLPRLNDAVSAADIFLSTTQHLIPVYNFALAD